MRRTERFNHRNNEAASLNEKAKKGVAAIALATTGLFVAGCSGGEGGSSIGGVLSVGGSNEVLYGESCLEAENIVAIGSIGRGSNLEAAEKFPDIETLKGVAAIPDGVAKLSSDARGYLIDTGTLSSRQDDQLWESYNKYTGTLEELDNKQASRIVVYGDVDQDLIEEYKRGDGWPESLTDGKIDSPDLNLCVIRTNDDVNSENWVR